MIGRLPGHANHQSTARYAHLDDEHLLDAAQQVGDEVGRLMGAQLKYCVFRRSRPLIPTRSRPPYRFEAGHHSDVKPAI
jgi:hypothetical protein